jgi:two-component system KDP operon response regulator KdpE
VLRRSAEAGGTPQLDIGDLVIDVLDRTVTRAGEEVHLTPIEFDLVRVLAQHKGRLVTHRQLLQEVWGPEYGEETHYLPGAHRPHPRKARARSLAPAVAGDRARRRVPAARALTVSFRLSGQA